MPMAEFERAEKLSASVHILRAIALEMIELTAADLARRAPEYTDISRGAHEARLSHETARRWVAGEYETTSPLPFGMCCAALGVEAEAVRHALTKDPHGVQIRLKAMSQKTRGGSLTQDREPSAPLAGVVIYAEDADDLPGGSARDSASRPRFR